MKQKYLLILLACFCSVGQLFAQLVVPRVPNNIVFAGMQLKIQESARKTIQSDVDAIYRSESYFKLRLQRVDLHFPIIEAVLAEEGLPGDFKYLVIQESALIPDAVSSSNAVGYWQFKKATAEEMGLRVDHLIDERMNLTASTRAAARYLKKNNHYLDNWIYALLSYKEGLGGAKRKIDDRYIGSTRMEITKNTDWYVLRFLAHKIAYEHVIGNTDTSPLMLVEYTEAGSKTLRDVARTFELEGDDINNYNKWLKRGRIPDDKTYAVLVPVPAGSQSAIASQEQGIDAGKRKVASTPRTASVNKPQQTFFVNDGANYPIIEGDTTNKAAPLLVEANGIDAIIARKGDTPQRLADDGEITLKRFLRFNDIEEDHQVKPGMVYYLKRKRGRAPVYYHTAMPEESLWLIAQNYGIREKALRRKNRIRNEDDFKPGLVVWLRFARPSRTPAEFIQVESEEEVEELTQAAEEKASMEEYEDIAPVIDYSEERVEVVVNRRYEVPSETETKQGKVMEESTIEDLQEIRERADSSTETVVTEKRKQTAQESDTMITNKDTVATASHSESVEIDREGFEDPVEQPNFVGYNERTEQSNVHAVKQGETLYSIARNYGIPVKTIMALNQLNDASKISIGQQLTLRQSEKPKEKEAVEASASTESGTVQNETIEHTVIPGETLYKIARQYGVTIKQVMEWNDKNDFSVAVGEVIDIRIPLD